MATHSSTIAWQIPRTEEPGRLQSMESQRVGHDRATKPSTAKHKGKSPFGIILEHISGVTQKLHQ